MKKEKSFRTKDMTKKELEKHFKILISNEEFRVVKDFVLSEFYGEGQIPYSIRFEPFYEYILAIHIFGAEDYDGSYRGKWSKKINLDQGRVSLEKWRKIRDEVNRRYPEVKLKRELALKKKYGSEEEAIFENKNQTYKKQPSSFKHNFQFFIFVLMCIGLAIGLFFLFNWAVDPSLDGGPKFFGHDGG